MKLDTTVTRQALVHHELASTSLNASARRVAVGSRLEGSSADNAGLSVAMKMDFNKVQNASQKINLQNFVTLLQSQNDALNKAGEVYARMGELAMRATDVTLTESNTGNSSDKELYNQEFSELSKELKNLIDLEINGRRLFGGVKADFTEGLQDRNDFSPQNLPQFATKDVQATQGKITLELSPGAARDQIWIFQGEIPDELNSYFEAPASGQDSDTDGLTDALYEYFDGKKDPDFQGIFTTGAWRTTGTSWDENYDQFVINFDSCATELEADYHENNDGQSGYAEDLRKTLESDGKFLLKAPDGNSTYITMIGINSGNKATYEVAASFEPSLPYNDIEIPGTDEIFPAISFGEIQCADISSTENALKAIGEIDAALNNLVDSQSSIAAAQSRYQVALDQVAQAEVALEEAKSRISDSDIALESTNLARQMIKMNMATDVIKKSANLADSLIALTTNHFRSHVLRNILY